jgi:hypothetical protein
MSPDMTNRKRRVRELIDEIVEQGRVEEAIRRLMALTEDNNDED